ncbi:ComEC/Rec2 family competence protein [Ligilactobacillus salivarius]
MTIIINLLYSPMILFTMGMQLSYLLTLVLILNEEENSIKIGIKMSGYSIPLMLWHTYQWNVLTTFLSICIIPIFEYIILPFTIIGVLLNVFSKISNTILFLISIFFEKLADSSPMITFGKPDLTVVILLLSLMICLEVSRRKM